MVQKKGINSQKKYNMKKASILLTVFLSFFFCHNVKAQTNDAYYSGKWTMTIFGTPYGDVKMGFVIEQKEGKYMGIVQDSTGVEISKISNVAVADKSITVSYTAMGYDLMLQLEPVDADNVKGILNTMFDTKGLRIKEIKQ